MKQRHGIETTIDGVTYPSISEAARALDLPYKKVYAMLRERPRPQKAKNTRNRVRRPIVIRGVSYASITEAAKAHGVSTSYVCHASKRGRLDKIGTRKSK